MEDNVVSDEKFASDMAPFIDAGLFTEIGHNADINVTVYNMCDTVYLAMPHRLIKGAEYGIAMTAPVAKKVLQDNMGLVNYITSLSPEELHANTVAVGPLTFNAIKKYKDKTDINGPTKSIDKNFEEKMLNKKSLGR